MSPLGCCRSALNESHRGDLGAEAHDVPPGVTKHMRQVEQEVDEAPTGGCQIRPREKHTDEKALHDRGHAEDQEEDKDHRWVAVSQNLSILRERDRSGEKNDRANIVIVKQLLRQIIDLSTESEDIQPRESFSEPLMNIAFDFPWMH